MRSARHIGVVTICPGGDRDRPTSGHVTAAQHYKYVHIRFSTDLSGACVRVCVCVRVLASMQYLYI